MEHREDPQPALTFNYRGAFAYVTAVTEDDRRYPGELARVDVNLSSGPGLGWQLAFRVGVLDGRMTMTEMLLTPDPKLTGLPTGGITSAVLRDIALGELLTLTRSALASAPQWASAMADHLGRPLLDDAELNRAGNAVAELGPKRGRKGYGDEHYRDIANAYLRLQAAGWHRGILKELAKEQDRPWQTVRDWVAEARRREFLSKATPGRAGAQPGPRLNEQEG